MTLWVLATVAVLFVGAALYAGSARDRYDAARWETEPNYCRYSASWKEVYRWWRQK